MPGKKRTQLVNGEIYHIVMRAIDGIDLFRDRRDYLRMVRDLFEFNDINPVSSYFRVNYYRNNVTGTEIVTLLSKKRKLLVESLVFCFMPNHVHLLVKQKESDGISKFMRKFSGYANYYNKKYKRRGHLFQGRYQVVHIKNDKQLITVFVYIHTNPVAIIYPKWKERGIKDAKRAVEFIESYRWSSYSDYLGRKNFPSLTSREFLLETMNGVKNSKQFVEDWLHFKKELFDENVIIE